VSRNSKFGKAGQNIQDVTWRTKYIFLSPATLNRHKSVVYSVMSVQQWKMDALLYSHCLHWYVYVISIKITRFYQTGHRITGAPHVIGNKSVLPHPTS
jgi:hypothetical protein